MGLKGTLAGVRRRSSMLRPHRGDVGRRALLDSAIVQHPCRRTHRSALHSGHRSLTGVVLVRRSSHGRDSGEWVVLVQCGCRDSTVREWHPDGRVTKVA
jgi:hypothetical protein